MKHSTFTTSLVMLITIMVSHNSFYFLDNLSDSSHLFGPLTTRENILEHCKCLVLNMHRNLWCWIDITVSFWDTEEHIVYNWRGWNKNVYININHMI